MKKKKILGIIVGVLSLLVIVLCIKYYAKSDKELIKQFFGISKTEYEIVDVENELSYFWYKGHYKATVRVKEEDMDSFIKEVEKGFSLPEEGEDDSIVFKNITGRKMKENDVIYSSGGGAKRKVINILAVSPKGCSAFIAYSEYVDGIYEVILAYGEL